MNYSRKAQLVIASATFVLASAPSIAQDNQARPPSQSTPPSTSVFEYLNEEVELTSVNKSFVTTRGNCDDDPIVDDDKTVFERADAARTYESCMKRTFGEIRAAQAQSNNIVGANALQNIESAVLTDVESQAEAAQAGANFMGLSWGLGFGYSFGEEDFIEDAEIVNGVVRVKDDKTNQARALLEFHRFFWCDDKQLPVETGCGPFVALAATSDDILKGVAVGFMYGWKSKDPAQPEGFSIGIGAILDNDVQSLADGFIENEAPPVGETMVRFKKEARWSGLLFVTRTF